MKLKTRLEESKKLVAVYKVKESGNKSQEPDLMRINALLDSKNEISN